MTLSDEEKQWIAAIRKSGRFDREFYLRWYGDEPGAGRNPERHYITTGESRGYWPRAGFCPEFYLEVNDDVADAGVSPFFHYVTEGEREGRVLRPVPLLWRIAAGELEFPPVEPPGPEIGRARFAVVLHVFHYEMWPEFARRIRSLGDDCDLFVTVTRRPDRDFDGLIGTIRKEFPGASVLPHPNHGRDIFPFLRLVNAGVLAGYEAICKLHTKKSPHLGSGIAWSDHLAGSLLPGPQTSRELAEKFLAAKSCGIMTADAQRKTGAGWWHGNRGRSLALLARAGIRADPERLSFPAGSMYWLKPAMVEALRRLRLGAEEFEPEFGQGDGTTAHAVERILGYLASNEGLRILEAGEISGQSLSEKDREVLEFCEPDHSEAGIEGEPGKTDSRKRWLPPVSRHVRYEGELEACSPRGVVGWIRELSDRGVACRLRLSIDGIAISEGFADQYRADHGGPAEAGACCGFTLPLPDGVFDGEMHGFQITVLGDAWLWQSLSFQARLAQKKEIGGVTGISGGAILGWCRDPLDPDFSQDIDLLIDGYFAGGTESPGKGEKKRGRDFRLEIPPSFRDGAEHDLKVIVRGSRICLWEGTETLSP